MNRWTENRLIMMVLASAGSYLVNEAFAKARYKDAVKFNF